MRWTRVGVMLAPGPQPLAVATVRQSSPRRRHPQPRPLAGLGRSFARRGGDARRGRRGHVRIVLLGGGLRAVAVNADNVDSSRINLVLNRAGFEKREPHVSTRSGPIGDHDYRIIITFISKPNRKTKVITNHRTNAPISNSENSFANCSVYNSILSGLISQTESIYFVSGSKKIEVLIN